MNSSLSGTNLYAVGLITMLLIWLLEWIGIFALMLPDLALSGFNAGPFVLCLAIYLIVWLICYFLERSYGSPAWVVELHARQGTAQFIDWCVIVASLIVIAVSIRIRIFSPYTAGTLAAAFAAALQSLLRRQPVARSATTP